MALRVGNWKAHFMDQRGRGLDVWREPFVSLRLPNIINVRTDPFERAPEDASMFYDKWFADHLFMLVPAQAIVGEYLKTFEEFPPRQRPSSFSIEGALEKAREKQELIAAAAASPGKRPTAQPRAPKLIALRCWAEAAETPFGERGRLGGLSHHRRHFLPWLTSVFSRVFISFSR